MMTKREREILLPPIRDLVRRHRGMWNVLKYETQYGPEFWDFPHYPAALELTSVAEATVRGLSVDQKQTLVQEWRRVPRLVSLPGDKEILERYAMMILEEVVSRARTAGARTSNWE